MASVEIRAGVQSREVRAEPTATYVVKPCGCEVSGPEASALLFDQA